jgi:DNA-binding transcriptional MerR regulator
MLKSGELARLCRVSTDTLRHYERVGVLPRAARTASGYRQYPPEAQVRVLAVRRALALGFSLAELARIFRVRERGGAPCREVRHLAEEKLGEIDQRLADLGALRDDLREILAEWDKRLAATPEGSRAGLLERLGKR